MRYEEPPPRRDQGPQADARLDLWRKMLTMLFETGHPWITFKDPCNIRSPQEPCGVVHSLQPLHRDHAQHLGRRNRRLQPRLGQPAPTSRDGALDHAKLRADRHGRRPHARQRHRHQLLPVPEARTANLRHRPVGLGMMGFQDALYKGVPFASQAAVEFSDEIMEAIAFYAYEASSDLAAERGTYPATRARSGTAGLLPPDTIDLLSRNAAARSRSPRGGKLDWPPLRAKIAAQGMRNSNVLAIAPTATISNITNTSPCIEPTYKNLYVKSNLSGEFVVLNPYLVKDLKARGLWNQEMSDALKYFDGELKDIEAIPEDLKARYLTAFGVDFKWVIDAAARRQKWIDQSQSVNLYIANPSGKKLDAPVPARMAAWAQDHLLSAHARRNRVPRSPPARAASSTRSRPTAA